VPQSPQLSAPERYGPERILTLGLGTVSRHQQGGS